MTLKEKIKEYDDDATVYGGIFSDFEFVSIEEVK